MQRSSSDSPNSNGYNQLRSFLLELPEEHDQSLIWQEDDEVSIILSESSSDEDDYQEEIFRQQINVHGDGERMLENEAPVEYVYGNDVLNEEDRNAGSVETDLVQDNSAETRAESARRHTLNQHDRRRQLDHDNLYHQNPAHAAVQHREETTMIRDHVLENIRSNDIVSSALLLSAASDSLSRLGRGCLLYRIILSTEEPIIRADIDWKQVEKEIQHYPAKTMGDSSGSVLLESVLRMDPPINIVNAVLSNFPSCCTNMDGFYTACQHSSSDQVVRLILQRTTIERKESGILWGMLTFLGDARINVRHATFLLQSEPLALLDPDHGMFGVSPLDRMLSGAFIHGGLKRWVQKLILALATAEEMSNNEANSMTNNSNDVDRTHKIPGITRFKDANTKFYFYHAMVRRLISPNFKGSRFGTLSFLRTLTACVEVATMTSLHQDEDDNIDERLESDDNDCVSMTPGLFLCLSLPPFHQEDNYGRLPLHVALEQNCKTNLGLVGERKLIKFLLVANRDSARKTASRLHLLGDDNTSLQYNYPSSVRYGKQWVIYRKNRWLPLRMSIANGWPCYDLLTSANPQSINDPSYNKDSDCDQQDDKNLALHVVLSGPYHPRFGVRGARNILRYFLKRGPDAATIGNAYGRFPLHLAIENGWPVHDLIIATAPMALEMLDGWSHFYPFQIAACFGRPPVRWIVTKNKKRKRKSALPVQDSKGFNVSRAGNDEKVQRDIDLSHLSLLYELIREAPLSCYGLSGHVIVNSVHDAGNLQLNST